MLKRLLVQMVVLLAAFNLACQPARTAAEARQGPLRLVALGDSLTAGFGLAPGEALPAVLQRLLEARGHKLELQNAGVSGDTTAGGLARLDWAVPDGTDGVILALGANDMLGGLPLGRARSNLESIIERLKVRGIPIMLAGMRASRSLGEAYAGEFDAIFPALAEKHGLVLYPFLLEGVALEPKLNQPDGIHPTAEGVRVIAGRMVPTVEAFITRISSKGAAAGR